MTMKLTFFDGTALKAINPMSAPDWMWTPMSVSAKEEGRSAITEAEGYNHVGDVFRAITLCANAAVQVPAYFYDTEGNEVGTADPRLKRLGNWPDTLWRLVASLRCTGAGYMSKLDSTTQTARWLMSSTIVPVIDQRTGLTHFTRNGTIKLTPEQLAYVWMPSPFMETGPGAGPLQVALEDAGVVRNISRAVGAFFERGMIMPTLIYSETGSLQKDQRDDLKAWLKRLFAGVFRAFEFEVISQKLGKLDLASSLKEALPEGLSEQQSKIVLKDLGVPHTLVWSDAANYATAQQDWQNLYDLTVLPDLRLLVSGLNEQYFKPVLGVEWYIAPEEMKVFQADETERASSLASLVGAGAPPDVAMGLLGYDLDPTDMARVRLQALVKEGASHDAAAAFILEGIDDEKLRGRVQAALALFAPAPVAAPPAVPPPGAAGAPVAVEEPPHEALPALVEPVSPTKADLVKWQTKALKRLKSGKPAACEFESTHIRESMAGAIAGALEAAENADDVRACFRQALMWEIYP